MKVFTDLQTILGAFLSFLQRIAKEIQDVSGYKSINKHEFIAKYLKIHLELATVTYDVIFTDKYKTTILKKSLTLCLMQHHFQVMVTKPMRISGAGMFEIIWKFSGVRT